MDHLGVAGVLAIWIRIEVEHLADEWFLARRLNSDQIANLDGHKE